MHLKNLKISTQLMLGFTSMMLFVIVLGVVSKIQSDKIHQQTELMYDHPLKVRRAIGILRSDVFSIQREMKDMLFSADNKDFALHLGHIGELKTNAFSQINIFNNKYLGPRSDIDALKRAFVTWNAIQEGSIRRLNSGEKMTAAEQRRINKTGEKESEELFSALQKLDDFAIKKGDALYESSRELNDSLNLQLVILVAVILLLSVIINYILLRNIRKPLMQLTEAAHRFQEGDMQARSNYDSKNEFGILSSSFNTLAESIQQNMDLKESEAKLSALMLNENEAGIFFHTTLSALSMYTDSQIAAVYLLNDDKKTFNHFESIGLDDNGRESFSAVNFEGEFGAALSSSRMQHIKNISENTRFIFPTVSGKFIPHEILTIPIVSGHEIIAVISLASIRPYSKQTLLFIGHMLDILNARIEGILAYRKMKDYSKLLESQNQELEAQKNEMAVQSAELTEQNTELEMQKKQLDEASRLKTHFLSNMSHELRTPLNSVIALSGVLNRRLAHKIPEEEVGFLEVIERNGKHLLSLINDILDISRIESGREEIEITRFDLRKLISEVANMILPQADQKKIELLQTGNGTDVHLTSDESKCRHILQNLIGNAVKFTAKGKVEITATRSGDFIEIVVTDTGIGISEAHLPHIFDEFRQADGSTSRRFGGTGLGLAIAKKYADMLGGTISVKSVPGKGSAFTFSLPAIYSFEKRFIPNPDKTGLKGLDNRPALKISPENSLKTILLIEDNEPTIIQMKDFLEENEYGILLARDGNEALEIISRIIPDSIILDLMMPGIDGFKVLKSLRESERTAQVPVLILTAKHITKEELSFLKQNHVHQLIQKGDVNRAELLNALLAMMFPEEAGPTQSGLIRKQRKGKPLVLVVEDNPDNMITVKALLSDEFKVLEAANGNTGYELAKKHMPDLILMDIALPDSDGLAIFTAIRKEPGLQHIPIIALTASAMISDREAILAHGFDSYIAKPIEEAFFFKIINETLYGK